MKNKVSSNLLPCCWFSILLNNSTVEDTLVKSFLKGSESIIFDPCFHFCSQDLSLCCDVHCLDALGKPASAASTMATINVIQTWKTLWTAGIIENWNRLAILWHFHHQRSITRSKYSICYEWHVAHLGQEKLPGWLFFQPIFNNFFCLKR